MIYESTVDNLIMLIRSAAALKQEQILHFFRDAADANNVEYYITQLAMSRIIDIDANTNLVRTHGKPLLKQHEIAKRVHAFWVIAAFGSENIREVFPLPYPSQFLFITQDNEAYDLTICATKMDAQLAFRDRKVSVPDGEFDVINHIAIVNSRTEGEALSAYKFDSFCVINANKHPEYFTWE